MLELPPPGCPRCLAGIMGHALSAAACPVPGRSQENSSLSVSPGSGAGRRGWTVSRAADEPWAPVAVRCRSRGDARPLVGAAGPRCAAEPEAVLGFVVAFQLFFFFLFSINKDFKWVSSTELKTTTTTK